MIKLTEDELNAALRTHEILFDSGSFDMRMTPEHKALDRRQKFNAQPVTVDDLQFDSKAEAKRYQELLLMQKAGKISELTTHPLFVLQAGFADAWGRKYKAITYIPDFIYREEASGDWVVEDVKGGKATQTSAFRIKWKLAIKLYHEHRFEIVEG